MDTLKDRQKQNISDYWEGKSGNDDAISAFARKAVKGAKGMIGMDEEDEEKDSGDSMSMAIKRRKMALDGEG